METKRLFVVLALPFALAGFGCGDGGGGEITNEAALQGVMERIALDFAQVLLDIAPGAVFATKGLAATTTDCPEGGTATYSQTNVGGSVALGECTMRGVTLTGTLSGGFIFADAQALEANQFSGLLSVSGAASAELTIQNLIVSVTLPITDESTFWQVDAITEEGEMICAWSGGGPCQEQFFF